MTPSGQTICLCMIVKNEAPVIRRCLESVRPLIDHWLVVDTGSTDGTQAIVRERLRDLSGQLVERPWLNFAHNRSEALDLARPHGDYSLIIDADDVFEVPAGFAMPVLDADSYVVDIQDGSIAYQRTQVVRNAMPWRYVGVLHEFLSCDGAKSTGHLPIAMRRNHDGARRRDPDTYRKDAAILERALETETEPFLRSRYTFYLAQSYRDCGEHEKAVERYLERAALGYWDQEVFCSLLQAGRLMEGLHRNPEEVLAVYRRATEACPSRAEASHAASRLCRGLGYNERGRAIAGMAIDLPLPAAGLFLEPWIYAYGALDEFAINAYWAGYYRDCLDASLRALQSGKVPDREQARLLANMRFAMDKLAVSEPGPLPDPLSPTSAASGVSPASGLLPSTAVPKVLVAILAKQKASVLPLYLQCIEALDYPKSSIVLHVRTNNNRDQTADILRDWLGRVSASYAQVEFDDTDIATPVETFGVHEWNATRFRALAAIRDVSLRRTIKNGCAFYFVADVDNFVKRSTLSDLVALNLPIVAPLLRHVDPKSAYSNYHADIDRNGYFLSSPRYHEILAQQVVGLIEVPVVHCTYLVRVDAVPRLRYDDGSGRHEYVIFSDSARRQGIPQYFDNRRIYGLLTLNDDAPELIDGQLRSIAKAVLAMSPA